MNIVSIASKFMQLAGEERYLKIKYQASRFVNHLPLLRSVIKRHIVNIWLNDKQMQYSLKLMANGRDDAEHFLNSLTVEELADRGKVLFARLKNYIQNDFKPGKKTVAIYLVGLGYTENLGTIPYDLFRKGYNVLGLVGSTPEQVSELYYEARKEVEIDACICVGLIEGMPEDTAIIYFVHDIHDSALTNMQKIYRLLPKCNYILVPNEPALNRYKEKVLEGRKELFSETDTCEVCFIRGGYPKLDSNIRYFQKRNEPPSTIIYATTVVEDIADMVSLPKHSDQIIETILTGVTDRMLIFRPHPQTMGSQEVAKIARKYHQHPRFVLDNNPSFYMDNYARSVLMISDLSGTAFTYALTTLRPVVFFSHNEAEVQKRFGSYQYFIDRDKVGYVVINVEDLLERVRQLIQNADSYSKRVEEYRNSFIYNVGSSEEYFVDNFEYIIENKKNPDWTYI
ncbi:hypothetical protein ACFLYQ_07330 [Chloroflexota bacterium]